MPVRNTQVNLFRVVELRVVEDFKPQIANKRVRIYRPFKLAQIDQVFIESLFNWQKSMEAIDGSENLGNLGKHFIEMDGKQYGLCADLLIAC